MKSIHLTIIATLVASTLILLWHQSGLQEAKRPAELIPVRIADTGTSPPGLLLTIAKQRGFFEAEGLRAVITTEFGHGKANIAAVLRGDADFATASEVPVMRAGLNGLDLCVIATIGKGDRHMAVVARRDHGIATLADLANKTLGVTVGSNAEYFFDRLLPANAKLSNPVRKVHTLPKDMAKTLARGDVDAVVSWFPAWKHAQDELGDNALVFHGSGVYSVYFNLISSVELVKRNPEMVKRMLRAFIRAERYVADHQQQAKATFMTQFHLNAAVTDEVFANYTLRIWLGQEFLIALESQAKWAMDSGITKQTQMPNYLNLVHLNALEQVSPEAVSIIH